MRLASLSIATAALSALGAVHAGVSQLNCATCTDASQYFCWKTTTSSYFECFSDPDDCKHACQEKCLSSSQQCPPPPPGNTACDRCTGSGKAYCQTAGSEYCYSDAASCTVGCPSGDNYPYCVTGDSCSDAGCEQCQDTEYVRLG